MKRPLGMVALLYGCGLLLGEGLQPPMLLLFAASFALAAAAVFVRKARAVLTGALIVFTGWTNLVWRTAILSPYDLRRSLPANLPVEVVVRGRLDDEPAERVYIQNEKPSYRTAALVRVAALRRGSGWQPGYGRILVSTPGQLPDEYFAGQQVAIAGVMAPPRGPVAEGLFNYPQWLRRQGVFFELKASSPADWTVVSSNSTPSLSGRFQSWAQATLARGLPEQDEALRLLWAMTLGCKSALPKTAYEPFIESGTMHIFAISGLHIALLAGILVRVLRAAQLSRAWCGAVILPLIWFYTGATGWQPSAIRSTIMMSVVIGGWSLKRPGDLLNSLAAAAFLILLWDPQQLFQAGFQLSFFVVLSIALFLPRLNSRLERMLQTDPFLPPDLVPRWRRRAFNGLRFLGNGLATSLAAWLGSWPLTAAYFHLFSPVTLLANLLLVPLSSAALACNLGSLLCGGWLPWAGEWFNHSAWLWMRLMMEASRLAVRIPGAFFYVRAPSPLVFVAYYGGLFVLLGGAGRFWRRLWTGAALVVVPGVWLWHLHLAAGRTQVAVLPLSGGSAIYCDAPGAKRDLLVDCGSTNAVEYVVKPFLRARGVNRLPGLVLTHGDVRQIGGTETLRAAIPVGQIAVSSARFRSPGYRRIIAQLDGTPERRRVLVPGDRLGDWTVLHPEPGDRFTQADDGALVLRGDFHGVRVLLLSDLGQRGQRMLLERAAAGPADIVVGGLPQASEPMCEALLDALQPRVLIVVDSEFPATRRAPPPLRERLARRGIPVLYTRDTGAVTLTLERPHWSVKAMNGFQLSGTADTRSR